ISSQNYTCHSSSPDVQPKALGAVATVFDASCIAANYPRLLSLLTNIALRFSRPRDGTNDFVPGNLAVLGHHYFRNATTAVFDLGPFGVSVMTKADSVDAPTTALKGVGKHQNGAIPWLRLKATNDSQGDTKTIYRLNTAV